MSFQLFEGAGYDMAVLPQGISIALQNDRPSAASRSGAGAQTHSDAYIPAVSPSTARPDPNAGGLSTEWIPWGDGNDFPQRLVDLYTKDPIIPTTLGKVAAMMTGRGVMPVLEGFDDQNKEIALPLPANDPVTREIRTFLRHNHFQQYLDEMASDAAWFFNGFPELILSKNRQKIVQLHPLNAEEIRWGKMTAQGDLTHVYLNATWPRGQVGDGLIKKIDAIDPYHPDRVAWLREGKLFNCVYPIKYPTPGKRYYSLAHHYSIVESGWLDVHLAVPAFKKWLMKNQMSIKYHIKIDKGYWPILFGAAYTQAKSDQDRQNMRKAWIDSLTKMLTNVESAGSTLVTQFEQTLDPKGAAKEYVVITPVTDTMKDGKFLDDVVEAAAHIFYALNVDPTIVGFAGGDKNVASSGGSNKREAYLIALQMMAPFRRMLLEPLDFVAEYNGWKAHFPDLTFQFRDTILTTLDTGAGTAKKLS